MVIYVHVVHSPPILRPKVRQRYLDAVRAEHAVRVTLRDIPCRCMLEVTYFKFSFNIPDVRISRASRIRAGLS